MRRGEESVGKLFEITVNFTILQLEIKPIAFDEGLMQMDKITFMSE